jgi:hypothetical protein
MAWMLIVVEQSFFDDIHDIRQYHDMLSLSQAFIHIIHTGHSSIQPSWTLYNHHPLNILITKTQIPNTNTTDTSFISHTPTHREEEEER